MAWIVGIVVAFLLDIVLIMTGNGWATNWILPIGIVYVVCVVVRQAVQDRRANGRKA